MYDLHYPLYDTFMINHTVGNERVRQQRVR